MDRVLATPIPHKEPMSALLTHLKNPWPNGYIALSDDAPPHGLSPRNPGQTSNPTVLNSRSISSPALTSVAGGKSSAQMGAVHSNVRGKPLA